MKEAKTEETKKSEPAYKKIKTSNGDELELFLDRFLSGDGRLGEEEASKLKEEQFLKGLLNRLNDDKYRQYKFAILTSPFYGSYFDLSKGIVKDFVLADEKALADFLIEEANAGRLEDEKNAVLYQIAVDESVNGKTEFQRLWNSFSLKEEWDYILTLQRLNPEIPKSRAAARLLINAHGKSVKAFIQALDDRIKKNGEAEAELDRFLQEYMRLDCEKSYDVVSGIIAIHKNREKRLEREKNLIQKENDKVSKKLFSCVYQPLESLESLASDLRVTEGQINCKLVSDKLMAYIIELRKSLNEEPFDLSALGDMDAWETQRAVKYDSEKYSIATRESLAGKSVKLQTLGFSYHDEKGNPKKRPAKAYTTENKKQKNSKGKIENNKKGVKNSSSRNTKGGTKK